PVEWAPDSVRLAEPAQTAAALQRLPAVVQDPAASWVSRYAEIPAAARVVDLCAAPGGKTLVAAECAGLVVAGDRSRRRLQRVRENVDRVGWSDRVALVVADARHPPFAPADVVLLDAPCLGSGTFRRHPDGRWRVGDADLAALADLQAELLRSAAPLVRPGGWLVYSTCSLEPEENEVQIARFLNEHPRFVVDPPAHLPAEVSGGEGSLLVLPQRTGSDGAFAVRLRRQA
ncbi:MAG: RsmB/NOP family class I SAM-dependent RNA methyltransferase, partial [Gemmatimonadota bacterium]|nr:RsmB/NOP family class I SAM-dependent RNA methyltransferase [Gemmatimonadota bacterium]